MDSRKVIFGEKKCGSMKQFDLFKLHKTIDIGAKSWICAKGDNLHVYIKKSIEESGLIAKSIIKDFSKKNNCSCGPIAEVLYFNKEWVPLLFLIYLDKRDIINKRKTLDKIEYLKINTAKSKPLIAVKNLTLDLCRIAGAHAADGNLHVRVGFDSKNKKSLEKILKTFMRKRIIKIKRNRFRYKDHLNKIKINYKKIPKNIKIWQDCTINLTEGDKSSVKLCAGWIKNIFGIDISVRKCKDKKAWRLSFSNKIIARYLTEFLDFPSGSKTYTVDEPEIIRKSGLRFRRAFLLGLMTFDGYVSLKSNKIGILMKNRKIINKVFLIMNELKIPVRDIRQDNINRWLCESFTLKENNLKKALVLFGIKTKKWQRIYEKIHGFEYRPKNVNEAKTILNKVYPKHSTNKIGVIDIFEILLNTGETGHKYIREYFNIEKGTLGIYIDILKRCNIIYTKNKLSMIYLNKNQKEWILPKIVD